jgi:hypothetical protein
MTAASLVRSIPADGALETVNAHMDAQEVSSLLRKTA